MTLFVMFKLLTIYDGITLQNNVIKMHFNVLSYLIIGLDPFKLEDYIHSRKWKMFPQYIILNSLQPNI